MPLTVTLLTLLSAAPGPELTRAAERLPLSGAPRKVTVDPFLGRIEVVGATVKGPSALCPKREGGGAGVTLLCSRRIWAGAEGAALEVRELRGLPPLAATDRLPTPGWPLRELGLAGDCDAPVGDLERGECAFGKGDVAAARAAFTRALDGHETMLAHLRLGDLALRDLDLAGAFVHYQHANGAGLAGRMADERACALAGTCPEGDRIASTLGLPGVMRRELILRTAVRELFAGRDADAMQRLIDEGPQPRPACDEAKALCQKLCQAALLQGDDGAKALAMKAYLVGGFREGPHEVELAKAVAVAAERLGAPGFGAGILSSVEPKLPPEEVDGALQQIVRLYLLAHDAVRASAVLDYADSRAGGRAKGKAWAQYRAQLRPRGPAAPPVPDYRPALPEQVSLANELARAALVRSAAVERLDQEAP